MALHAEFGDEITAERTKAGLNSVWAWVRKGGRPYGYSKETIRKVNANKVLYDVTISPSVQEIADSLKIRTASCYRYLKAYDVLMYK